MSCILLSLIVSEKATLEEVTKYGQCSQLTQGKSSTPSLSQIISKTDIKLIAGGKCSSESTCRRQSNYFDGSSLSGSFATENTTINIEEVDRLMGLNRNTLSIISQISFLFKNYFSHCLPSFIGYSTGYITFGKTNSFTNKVINFTPLTTDSDSYDIEITGLSLGGHKLPMTVGFCKKAGGSIDSAQSFHVCHPWRGHERNCFPKNEDLTQVCLAFVPNPSEHVEAVIGNTQQQGMEVYYDIAGKRIGFGSRAC
ncbi:hypothetical protein Pint_12556 [Pistacia integerrima]|uniref:Uncharacterized protein n=1 Tax=Pistacia integerrima TaxID=434235 RepID=A0ACC0Y900_9ROSI|nr:hypothetical protein Pint_12556 [Pistacia integerrima]